MRGQGPGAAAALCTHSTYPIYKRWHFFSTPPRRRLERIILARQYNIIYKVRKNLTAAKVWRREWERVRPVRSSTAGYRFPLHEMNRCDFCSRPLLPFFCPFSLTYTSQGWGEGKSKRKTFSAPPCAHKRTHAAAILYNVYHEHINSAGENH